MVLYLVHHGDALGPEVDPQRPLSSSGRTAVERLAREAAARGVKPAVIWHSGKLRARQTAEAFWRACNPLAGFAAARGLQPTDSPDHAADLVAGEARDIMIVGHQPNLARVLNLLVTGDDAGGLAFPPHGVVMLERSGDRWSRGWQLQP